MITLALPKGRLLEEVRELLARAGLPPVDLGDGRLVSEPVEGLRYLLTRPGDVVTYVKEGAADLGVAGKDVLVEDPGGYYELLDLGIGRCRLSVAALLPPDTAWEEYLAARGYRLRVATKHPLAARQHFSARGIAATIIPLGGALELAPQVGLADVIVDLVQTGRTLAANGLTEVEEIMPVTARLLANPASLRLSGPAIQRIARALRAAAAGAAAGAVGGGEAARVRG